MKAVRFSFKMISMAKPFNRTVTLFGIYKQLVPFIRPYRLMIYGTLFLTFLGALAAQVNPIVLKYTVDEVTELTHLPHPMSEGIHIHIIINPVKLADRCRNVVEKHNMKHDRTNGHLLIKNQING